VRTDLNQRSILRGVQCVCGQWWPDYVMQGSIAIMECCGSRYQHASMSNQGSMLCLIEDNTPEARMKDEGTQNFHAS
jgi:hypothetical protein